jgi:FG-GAP-like repeat/Ig-like domain CHU_C associated/Dual-action HEIGH metallo-peptidase
MTGRTLVSRLATAALLLVATPLFAATFVVPNDRDLVARADAIVIGTALDSYARESAEGGIETVTVLSVSDTLKGRLGATINVVEPGGTLDGVSTIIAGVPQFAPGERVLLFLRYTGADRWSVADLAVGKFRFTEAGTQRLLERDAGEVVGWDPDLTPHEEHPRDAARFVAFIRDVAAGRTSASQDYFAPLPAGPRVQSQSFKAQTDIAPYTATSYTMIISGTMGGRWTVFPSAVTFYSGTTQEPGAPGGGTTAITTAFSSWNNDCGSNVNYVYGGTDNGSHTQGLHAPDGANTVLFERDLSAWGIAPFTCSGSGYSGTLGLGGITSASGTNTVNGETFVTTQEGDVEMNKGLANCTLLFSNGDFNSAVTHEVGHTLGFRHSDQNRSSSGACTSDLECSTNAIMKSFVSQGLNAQLQAWDQHAVQAVYPGNVCSPSSPPTCTAPAITAQPQSTVVTQGNSTTLSVTATGTAPLSYQWYTGTSGNTASPIPGGTGPTVTVSPSSTTSYWVRVSNSCGSANSSTATVTVQVPPPPPTNTLPNAHYTNSVSNKEWRSVGAGDFNGDGHNDILFQNTSTGQLVVWFMNGTTVLSNTNFLPTVSSTNWHVAAVADFNRDGHPDILFQNYATGQLVVWLLNGMTVISNSNFVGTVSNLDWLVRGAGDFNGDGWQDLLFERSSTGQMVVWLLNGTTVVSNSNFLPTVSSTAWVVQAIGDFDHNGSPDIVFRHQTLGYNVVWLMSHLTVLSNSNFLPNVTDLNWRIVTAADFNGDGQVDILWQNSATLQNAMWFMNGLTPQ